MENKIKLLSFDVDGNIMHMRTMVYLRNNTTNEIEAVLAHKADQNPSKYYAGKEYSIVDGTFEDFKDFSDDMRHP
jgi:hypothetical protein